MFSSVCGEGSFWATFPENLRGTSLTQQVDLVNDEDGHLLNVTAILPASAHSVPLLRCGDDEVRLGDGSHVWGHVPCQLHHSAAGEAVFSSR